MDWDGDDHVTEPVPPSPGTRIGVRVVSGSGEFYDRTTGQPSESRPWCPHFHIGGAGGVIDGKLYVAGGDGTFGLSSALDIYDAVTNKWTVESPMPAPRSTATGVVLGKKLYYTPSTNRWATAATMPTPRRLLGAKRIAARLTS